MGLRAAFRIPTPNEQVRDWHVSPVVDRIAYAFGWLLVLVPSSLLGPVREDYLFWYLLTIALTDLHRHFGLPYVYLDQDVRRRYPARFWLFPGVLLLLWMASPALDHAEGSISVTAALALAALLVLLVQVLRRDGGEQAIAPASLVRVLGGCLSVAALLHVWTRSFGLTMDPAWWWFAAALTAATAFDWQRARNSVGRPSASGYVTPMLILALMVVAMLVDREAPARLEVVHLLAGVGVLAGLWNFWHVYMQKFGILRMYSAKARGQHGGSIVEVPHWADKALVLCWLPLYFAYLGPMYREIAVDYFDDAAAVLPGMIDLLEQVMPITVPLGAALVIVVHGLWLRTEWQANRLRCRPRLAMAIGTSGLALCFFALDPIKVYLAFAFSHALEYCVFVWAFQRKRYQAPLAHDPALGRMLRHPVVFYVGMILVFGVALLLLKYWGRFIMPGAARPELFGHRTAYWLGFWGVYQSLVHFYFDGFLWKMRLPSVRANL